MGEMLSDQERDAYEAEKEPEQEKELFSHETAYSTSPDPFHSRRGGIGQSEART